MVGNGRQNVDEIDFHHPYNPYQIQKDLMLALYQCIEEGKVGIFESPTGTGKSLSILCGSLTWLRTHKREMYGQEVEVGERDDEPDWMQEHTKSAKLAEITRKRADLESKLDEIRRKERKVRENASRTTPPRKRLKVSDDDHDKDDDAEFALEDYASGDEGSSRRKQPQQDNELSEETRALLRKIGIGPVDGGDDNDATTEDELKIFICSRTHSQLSQLVGELRRINIPSALPGEESDEGPEEYPIEAVKQLSLGSRKNLCINDKVRNLPSTAHINERCLELQESKTPQDRRCKYLPGKDSEALTLDLKHHALAKVRDIEDLAQLGKKIGICPYYASRAALQPSELVTLPYPLLLQKSAREALDINVKDHVVIIDEAHNLMDAIAGIHTVEISLAQLQTGREQLMTYLQKFRNRLAGKNRVYVTQTVRLLDALKRYLEEKQGQTKENSGVAQPNDLFKGKSADQVNVYKLVEYLHTSKLPRKVQGYVVSQEQISTTSALAKPSGNETSRQGSPVLSQFQNFILALTNPAREGRFFWYKGENASECKLKYLLLDPSEHFKDIVEDARSVIMVGGTMSPMDDYRSQLFPSLPESKLTMLSCGHVISRSNLFISTVTSGMGGTDLDFTFSKRNSTTMLQDLGRTLVDLTQHIPDGVVVFFPSYTYLDQVITTWRKTSSVPSISSLLEKRKKLFIDSQNSDTDAILQNYTSSIQAGQGAILFSVIGGKLSEGINFSDSLGRAVIVIGLPYPNPNAAEWKAKMEYIEDKARISAEREGKVYIKGTASRDFADNVCMRAVNQAVGRAVRHKEDWAGVFLVDGRYAQRRIWERLPGWMKGSVGVGGGGAERRGYMDVVGEARGFYERRMGEA